MLHHRILPAVVAGLIIAQSALPDDSVLWGENGERWSAMSRLPDFSFAGYQRGERPLPRVAPNVSVKDFGALGDGRTDDTAAFQQALREAPGKAISVPAGRYVITDVLTIETSGAVLLGEDPRTSVLYCPTPLEVIRPNPGATTSGRPTSNYSWSGGFIDVRGAISSEVLARLIADAPRGSTELTVDHAERFQAGDEIRLLMDDTSDNSLALYLYAGDSGPVDSLQGRVRETFLARVVDVRSPEDRIVLDRPLRCDARMIWNPRLVPARSTVEEVGIENLGFEFPVTPYAGHFTEQGYNAIALRGVRNCWVRNVSIQHADSGIFVSADQVTLTGIRLASNRLPDDSRNSTGHHGISLTETDCLLTDFDVQTRFIHDITVSSGSAGNVVMNGRGIDLALDHHRYAPHANLWTNLDAGIGTRLFRSGGGAKRGWHSGAWETFWNIRTQNPQAWPQSVGSERKWGCDLMTLVGLKTDSAAILDPDGRWFETIAPETLQPQNLYEAQLRRRRRR